MTRRKARLAFMRLLVCGSLLGILCLAAAQGATSQSPLPMFNAEYSLKRNGLTLGVSTRSLSAAGDGTYIYASSTRATGIIAWFVKDHFDEYSKWTLNGKELRPLEYVYNRHGGNKTRHVKLKFDWQHLIVTNTIDGDPWRMSIPPDAQDKLVYQLSIMYDLMKGTKHLEYKIADGGKLKDYEFEIEGEETLDTVLGKIKAVRIQRIGDKRDTTVWCAPRLSYLPVRLEQQDTDGAKLTMTITSLRGIPVHRSIP
ncbi:MAG: DUF3108 domain-containing protein [Gammaproteobacteria bacterium]|jgi:hypothetical protein